MKNTFLRISAFLGFLTVVFGAFGAHALKERLSADQFHSFETATRYQMYHVLLLILINAMKELEIKKLKIVNLLLVFGIVLFSGSIYLITLQWVAAKYIWFITPLGGLLLIGAWLLLAIGFVKKYQN
ncbi:MAG: DUF423 domain-containing protein [Flavicella sp.]